MPRLQRTRLDLARLGSIDVGAVLTLCEEGEALSRQMEDEERADFLARVKQALSQGK